MIKSDYDDDKLRNDKLMGEGWKNGWKEGRMDGRRKNGWKEEWMDG